MESRTNEKLAHGFLALKINECIPKWREEHRAEYKIIIDLIGDILKVIAAHPLANRAVQKFKMRASFDKLSDKLNNYVHSNGRMFYNESYNSLMMKKKTKDACVDFEETTVFIIVAFIFLLVLIHPISIMSFDYIDSLEFGEEPVEDAQYWVAPFISEFLEKYNSVLDEKCVGFLREMTGMKI